MVTKLKQGGGVDVNYPAALFLASCGKIRVDRCIPCVYDTINRYTLVYQNMPMYINLGKKNVVMRKAVCGN